MYVGNLDFQTTEADLLAAFRAFGSVQSATVMRDGATGHARGFGFVEMKEQAEATAALKGLEGSDLRGRALTVRQETSILHEGVPLSHRHKAR